MHDYPCNKESTCDLLDVSFWHIIYCVGQGLKYTYTFYLTRRVANLPETF